MARRGKRIRRKDSSDSRGCIELPPPVRLWCKADPGSRDGTAGWVPLIGAGHNVNDQTQPWEQRLNPVV